MSSGRTPDAPARVGLFGGSFNPIHAGHVNIARQALADWSLDVLYVIPAFVSPFKTDAPPDRVAAGFTNDERWRLVTAACAEAGDSRLVPWDVELVRGTVSYAIDTVRLVRERHPGADLFFVIGADSVAGLSRWKDWETLRTLCRFVDYPRTPESSTEIRRRLGAGEQLDGLVTPAVAALLRHMRPRS